MDNVELKRYAVIPTGNRPVEYERVIIWCEKQNVTVVTIATSPEAIEYAKVPMIQDDILNIQRWWNKGLDYIAGIEKDEYIVAILNDDVILPDSWFDVIERESQGYSGASGSRRGLITGYAFVLRDKSIRADENMMWHYGDDDIQRQCDQKNGFNIIPTLSVRNLYGNSETSRFEKQIEKDRLYFEKKWL